MRFLVFMMAAMLSFLASAAIAADWVVERASQPVAFTVDGEEWVELSDGMTLPDASWIRTGPKVGPLDHRETSRF